MRYSLKGCPLLLALLIVAQFAYAGNGPQKFVKTLKLEGISFQVTCPNDGSLNKLTITPDGLKNDNSIITKKIDGMVYGAEIADINNDRSPEIYIFVTSAGSGSYGSLIAYSTNHGKSLSEIYLPNLEDDQVNAKGYMGHDKFSICGDYLVRSFPVYRDGDANAAPTGGIRKLTYKLFPGEAGWQLKLFKSSTR